jgi:hypothetical protein
VGMRAAHGMPACITTPNTDEPLDDCRDRNFTRRSWTEIPALGVGAAFHDKALCEAQIGRDWVEDVLPGSYRIWASDLKRLAGVEGTDRIRDQTVLRPISSADDISRSRGGDMAAAFGKKAAPLTVRHQFSAALAVAIGITAAESIRFTIPPEPFLVVVTLIACYDHDAADALNVPCRLEQIDSSHDIDRVGRDGLSVGEAHKRLRCHMNDDIGLCGAHGVSHGIEISYIANRVSNVARHTCDIEQIIPMLRSERESMHVCAEMGQQERCPSSLESGMTGQEHPSTIPESRIKHDDVRCCDPLRYPNAAPPESSSFLCVDDIIAFRSSDVDQVGLLPPSVQDLVHTWQHLAVSACASIPNQPRLIEPTGILGINP